MQISILDREECKRGVGLIEVETTAGKRQLPLAGVQITARVVDTVAEVRVCERFRNDFDEFLEAIYIFPLSGSSVVSSFEMRIGTRVIRGAVKERTQARKDYTQALEQGKRAALLEQERDDVFTVSIGNLPPGEEVTVELIYSEKLPYFEDGACELHLPLVVAPRYIPGNPLDRDSVGSGVEHDTNIVADASRITPPRLVDGFDPNVDLSIEVDLLGQISSLSCSHAIRTSTSEATVKVGLAHTDERLNRDFVLRWRVATEKISSHLLVYKEKEGQAYGMLSILPPRRDGFLGVARDVVFVLDRSGSMDGLKMTSAARACAILLKTLGPRDRFAIQAFDDCVEWLEYRQERLLEADEEGIARGEKYLRTINARGGTEMYRALGDALQLLDNRSKRAGRASVIVFITDGQVGDESRILKRIQQEIGDARVFTVGVDTAVNKSFLKRLARLGGGTCTTVNPGAHLEEALQAVGREIGNPLAVELRVGGETVPSRIPDLFAGRAVTVFLELGKVDRIRIQGKFTDGTKLDKTVVADYVNMPAIAQLWAKAKITELEDEYRISLENPEKQQKLREQIVGISTKHSVLTRFTAFVVVDDSEKINDSNEIRSLAQPVETPKHWRSILPGGYPSMPPDSTLVGGYSPAMLEYIKALSSPAEASSLEQAFEEEDATGSSISFLDKLQDSVSRLFVSKKRSLKPKAARTPDSSEQVVLEKLKTFAELLHKLLEELRSGHVPEAESLELARRDLVAALGSCSSATDLVDLQRFLRASAVELVSALSTANVTAESLQELFEKRLAEFEDAQNKALSKLGASSPNSFWGQSI